MCIESVRSAAYLTRRQVETVGQARLLGWRKLDARCDAFIKLAQQSWPWKFTRNATLTAA